MIWRLVHAVMVMVLAVLTVWSTCQALDHARVSAGWGESGAATVTSEESSLVRWGRGCTQLGDYRADGTGAVLHAVPLDLPCGTTGPVPVHRSAVTATLLGHDPLTGQTSLPELVLALVSAAFLAAATRWAWKRMLMRPPARPLTDVPLTLMVRAPQDAVDEQLRRSGIPAWTQTDQAPHDLPATRVLVAVNPQEKVTGTRHSVDDVAAMLGVNASVCLRHLGHWHHAPHQSPTQVTTACDLRPPQRKPARLTIGSAGLATSLATRRPVHRDAHLVIAAGDHTVQEDNDGAWILLERRADDLHLTVRQAGQRVAEHRWSPTGHLVVSPQAAVVAPTTLALPQNPALWPFGDLPVNHEELADIINRQASATVLLAPILDALGLSPDLRELASDLLNA